MLDLQSPQWSSLSHAYGDASNVPQLIKRLRAASAEPAHENQKNTPPASERQGAALTASKRGVLAPFSRWLGILKSRVFKRQPDAPALAVREWDAVLSELMPAILHQGDVYTATYAAMPHLLELATELGPSEQSDHLLYSLACAADGGVGPEVPEFLEESWEDAQDEARDLMLERLINGEVSAECAGLFIAGILYLSGEWSWGTLVDNWVCSQSLKTKCANCGNVQKVCWYKDRPQQSDRDYTKFSDVEVTPSTESPIPPDLSLEFEDEMISGQLLGLAHASGNLSVENQVRNLFGTLRCPSCGSDVPLTSAYE